MKYSNNNLLKGNFNRRNASANAAQYIALKRFEKAKKRGFIFDGFIIAAIVYCATVTCLFLNITMWGAI
jgi:hypothetical protein